MDKLCDDVICVIISHLSTSDIASLHYAFSYNKYFIDRLEKCILLEEIDMYTEYQQIYEDEDYNDHYINDIVDEDFNVWEDLTYDD